MFRIIFVVLILALVSTGALGAEKAKAKPTGTLCMEKAGRVVKTPAGTTDLTADVLEINGWEHAPARRCDGGTPTLSYVGDVAMMPQFALHCPADTQFVLTTQDAKKHCLSYRDWQRKLVQIIGTPI